MSNLMVNKNEYPTDWITICSVGHDVRVPYVGVWVPEPVGRIRGNRAECCVQLVGANCVGRSATTHVIWMQCGGGRMRFPSPASIFPTRLCEIWRETGPKNGFG